MKWTIASPRQIPSLEKFVNSAYRGEYAKKGWTTEADLLGGIRINKDMLLERIEKTNSWILIFQDDPSILLGCVHLELTNPGTCYLGLLTVEPSHQGGGLGRKILEISENFAREKSATIMEMTVIDGRTELMDWYIRRGYLVTDQRRPFPMDDPKYGIPKRPLEFLVLRKTL